MSAALRSPDLFRSLRAFCLGAFFDLGVELERGADIPVALAEHGGADRPTLYEYRPLVGAFIEERSYRLGLRDDAREALTVLKDEPAAGIFARAHADEGVGEDEALRRMVLFPLLIRTAEGCAGFDWDDIVFERAYADLEGSLFGDRRAYSALAPLVGLTAGGTIELGRGLRVRPAARGELTASWPEANRLLPPDFGREVDRTLVVELERDLDETACQPPDAALEFGLAVSALRLATPGAVAAGPVLFERLDWRPYGVRPIPPLAAQVPSGEPTRLDPFRARLAAALQARLAEPPSEPDLLEALLGCDEGPWAAAMRAAVLLGEAPRDRGELLISFRALLGGDGPGGRAEDAVRRAIVETLLHDSRDELVRALDDSLLGLRPRPQLTAAARVAAAG